MYKIGKYPYYEVSSKGDKRFSAFYARIIQRGNRSVEEIYQAAKIMPDGSTGLTWRQAKGHCPMNITEVAELYHQLWKEYLDENPHLMNVLKDQSGLSDMFGKEGNQCQADTLWRLSRGQEMKERRELFNMTEDQWQSLYEYDIREGNIT